MRIPFIGVVLLVVVGSASISAQWLNFKTPGVPRTPDGMPKLDAPTPRTAEGHPDLSGVWAHDLTPLSEMRRLYGPLIDAEAKNELPGMEARNIHKYVFNILADFTPADSPERPETRKIYRDMIANRSAADACGATNGTGALPLFPLPGLLSEPIKILQAARETVVMYELVNYFRQIYTDGRSLPTEYSLPSFWGYSVGRWDRDTFIVESGGFNDKTSLDGGGHPHSEGLHVVERFRRRDFGHLDSEMTFDDPKMYTRPFTVKISYHLLADADIFEMFPENEKDCAHIRAATDPQTTPTDR